MMTYGVKLKKNVLVRIEAIIKVVIVVGIKKGPDLGIDHTEISAETIMSVKIGIDVGIGKYHLTGTMDSTDLGTNQEIGIGQGAETDQGKEINQGKEIDQGKEVDQGKEIDHGKDLDQGKKVDQEKEIDRVEMINGL